MMKPLDLITQEEIENIHEKALVLLETTGVQFMLPELLSRLQEEGLQVDFDQQLVRFPGEQLEARLSTVPRRFVLGARSPELACHIGEGGPYARSISGCVKIIDRRTGICRDGTMNDVAEAARLIDALPNQAACGGFIYPMDVDRTVADVALLRGMVENSAKHIQMQPFQGRNMEFIIEMLEAVSGGKSEIRANPLISVVVAPTSPLRYDRNEVEVLIAAAEHSIPMITASTPVCGVSGPITLAGMAVLQHAETLAAMAVHQIVNSGAPAFYAPRACMMDMRNANAVWGPIEFTMLNLVWLQLGRHCNFAVDSMSCTTDSKTTDEQSGIEKALNALGSCLGGPDILGGFGMLETINTACFEQLVIDDELMGIVKRFQKGIKITEETLALDLIQRVGVGGQYLDQEHTMKFYQKNHYLPTIFDRNVRGTWENNGSKDVVQVAKQRVEKLLSEHTAPALPYDVLRELERIWQAAIAQD